MRYQEPELEILRMNIERIICESVPSDWIEEGSGIPGGDSGSYGE